MSLVKKLGSSLNFTILATGVLFLILIASTINAQEKSMIFPLPQQIEETGERFTLNEETLILIPQNATKSDLKLARSLVRELSDKYGIALNIKHVSGLPDDHTKYVLMGVIDNPLINTYCTTNNIEVSLSSPGKEGYVLRVEKNRVIVAGWDEMGAFYGLQSLRQLVRERDGFEIMGVQV